MNIMKTSMLRTFVISTVLFIVSHTASAQLTPYVWVDENGIKQFSDQPPPASVPKSRIIKFPGKSADNQDATSDANGDAPKAAKQPDGVADKELAYKKRREEIAVKEKKAEDDAKAAAAKTDNCKRMRDYKASLDSGQRIAETDVNGNRSYLSDDKRAQQLTTLDQNLADCGN